LRLTVQVAVPGAIDPLSPAYPYPPLTDSGRTEERTFPAIVVENAWTEVWLVPALGGRIMRWRDKRVGVERIAVPSILLMAPGGARGLTFPAGVVFTVDGPKARTEAAPCWVHWPPADSDDRAELVLAMPVTGTGLSWSIRWILDGESAALQAEVRVQNRSFQAHRASPGMRLTQAQLAPFDPDGAWAVRGADEWQRYRSPRLMEPWQVDVFRFAIVPTTGLGTLLWTGESATVEADDTLVRVAGLKAQPAAQVDLRKGEQVVTAEVSIYRERMQDLAHGLGGRPDAAQVRIAGVIESGHGPEAPPEPHPPEWHAPADWGEERNMAVAAWRAGTRRAQAAQAASRHEWARAGRRLEDALLYAGDDAALWALRAAVARHEGEHARPDDFLPNAFFLDPTEPLLRAESVLGQPAREGKGPNPLLEPFRENPAWLIEAAVLLLEARLTQDADRFLDEAIRIADVPMLRYLRAWELLSETRMEAEAALQVAQAAKVGFVGPYPFRTIEFQALRELSVRFHDATLAKFATLSRDV
jgi:hypothetical protein